MTPLFEAILRISVEASVLCVLVLIARLIVGRRPGRMLTVLYALIAIRLIVPFALSSPLSVHNIFREPQQQIVAVFNDKKPDMINDLQIPIVAAASNAQPQEADITSNTVTTPAAAAHEPSAEPLTMADVAVLIWALGMAAMAGTILTGNALFLRRIRRNREYNDSRFVALLNDCKKSLGLRRNIRVICASETGTAAVYGVFRPVLLISPASFELLTEAQQRHVLLHELSHIRRRDTLVCAGATVLNIVHWFNPSVWLVFALMRRDIEVQCDAHVFRSLPGTERTDYAGTLLKLAGPVQTPRLAPALFISKANIKRRIVMIIKHKSKSALFTVVALLVTVIVAVTGCTTAVEQAAEPAQPAPSPSAIVEVSPESTPLPTLIPETSKPAAEPELMATFTIDNSTHNNENRMANIQKAADLINGVVIKPGETFSVNDALGPRETSMGWKAAAGITDGAYVSEIGGGVCAVSSALYNAAIRAEMEIVDISHHSIPLDYMDGGLDAAISTGAPDLKIKNPYNSNVTIETKLEGLLLTVNVYGPAMDCKVDFLSEKAADEDEPPVVTYVYNTAIAPDGTKIAPGTEYEYTKARSPETYTIYKVYYDTDGKETTREIYAMVTYGMKGVVYVNGPDPAIASADSEAKPTPAPTPMPSAKVKESN